MSPTLAAAVWLAACTTPAPDAPQEAPPPPGPAAAPPVPAPPPPEPTATAPVSPSQVQQGQRLALAAVEMLEQGHEEQALAEIGRALQADPGNRLAQSLLRQVQADPQQLLGRESFSYRVQPGESLSRIAGRFLNDVHLFYALARYNDIKVPRQVQEGQLIRVPGKAPPPTPAPPAPPPAPLPHSAPAVSAPAATESPPAVPSPPAAAPESPRGGAAPGDEALVSQHYRRGLALMAQQKPAEAIGAFDAVLERDPQHANAKLRRAQALNQVGALIRLLENSIRRLDAQIAQEPGNASLKAQRAKAVSERERLLTVK